jgi:hypothetical protein
LKPFKAVEGVFENIEHKTFTTKDLKAIADCLFQEANKLSPAEVDLSFIISFHDHSIKIQNRPEIFENIKKQIGFVSMHLRTPDGSHEARVELNETIEERANSFLSITGTDLDWIFAVQGKLKDIIKELDNKTDWIYKPPSWLGFLLLLFNLSVVILFSYSFLLLFNKVLHMPQIYSIVLFVIIVQLLIGIISHLTTNRFKTVLMELRPRVELVVDKTRMEREKKSTRWAFLKYFLLPLVISSLAAFLSLKFLQ